MSRNVSANYAAYMTGNLNYKLARFQKVWENYDKEKKQYTAWYNKTLGPRKRVLEGLVRHHAPLTRTQRTEWNNLYSNRALMQGALQRARTNKLQQKSMALRTAYLAIRNIVPENLRSQIMSNGGGINLSTIGPRVYNHVLKLRALRTGHKFVPSLIKIIAKKKKRIGQRRVILSHLALTRGNNKRSALSPLLAASILSMTRNNR